MASKLVSKVLACSGLSSAMLALYERRIFSHRDAAKNGESCMCEVNTWRRQIIDVEDAPVYGELIAEAQFSDAEIKTDRERH